MCLSITNSLYLQRGISSSKDKGSASLNVPQKYQLPILSLRLLCLIPAFIGAWTNISKASSRAEFDSTGLFENKSTPLIHNVALLWVSCCIYSLECVLTW